MLKFFKHIIQLILSPTRGWEDISADTTTTAQLCHDGLYPLLGIMALSNFIQLFFVHDLTLVKTIEQAVIDFGCYFACYFLGVLIMEQLLPNLVSGELNRKKIEKVTIYAIALLSLVIILDNCMPTSFTVIHLLPIFVALIIYKSDRYLAIRSGEDVSFMVISIVALVIVPTGLRYVLSLLV